MNTYKTTLDTRLPGEKNDCAVIAVSLFAKVTYAEAHAALKKHGRVDGKGTQREMTRLALEDLGCKPLSIPMSDVRQILAHYPAIYRDSRLTTGQVTRFPEIWADAPDMLLFVPRHVAACMGGKVEDWTEGKRNRIEAIWVREGDLQRAAEFFARPVPAKEPKAPALVRGTSTEEALAQGPRAVMFTFLDVGGTEKPVARKVAVAWGISQGITPNTAAALYQHWRKARGLTKTPVEA